MGGDGGVIAVKRAYCRGAGTADHTGDFGRNRGVDKTVSDREEALQRMTTCYLTKLPLPFDRSSSSAGGASAIVACPYGRLYQKEAAVEALLRRKQGGEGHDELGDHIRGLKDLYNVRFQFASKDSQMPSCPVTGQEFNGQLPAILLVPGNPENPNVVSQRAFKEMGKETLQTEYGPFSDEVRLAPPPADLEEIKEALQAKRAAKKSKDKSGKKKVDKKRKDNNNGDNNHADSSHKKRKKIKHASKTNSSTGGGTTDVVRGRVQDAIKSNDNLSSLFTTKDNKKNRSQKEQAANLFAR